jgi:hypothetical protein
MWKPIWRFAYLDRQPVAATDAALWQSETPGMRFGKNGKKRPGRERWKERDLSDLTNLTNLTGVLISTAEALYAELSSCFDPATLAVLRNHSKMRTLPTRVAAR